MSAPKAQNWSTVLLRDLVRPAGLTPCLGEETRPEVLLTHLTEERQVVGETLQRIDALMACVWAYAEDHQTGKISQSTMIDKVFETLWVIDMELRYDETAALTAA